MAQLKRLGVEPELAKPKNIHFSTIFYLIYYFFLFGSFLSVRDEVTYSKYSVSSLNEAQLAVSSPLTLPTPKNSAVRIGESETMSAAGPFPPHCTSTSEPARPTHP
jgi:hypothetical protein